MHPLQNLIYKKGRSVKSLCDNCDINRATLYKIFDGKTKSPSPRTVYILSDELHESYEKIMALCTEGL